MWVCIYFSCKYFLRKMQVESTKSDANACLEMYSFLKYIHSDE
jgi:hypothetical protein